MENPHKPANHDTFGTMPSSFIECSGQVHPLPIPAVDAPRIKQPACRRGVASGPALTNVLPFHHINLAAPRGPRRSALKDFHAHPLYTRPFAIGRRPTIVRCTRGTCSWPLVSALRPLLSPLNVPVPPRQNPGSQEIECNPVAASTSHERPGTILLPFSSRRLQTAYTREPEEEDLPRHVCTRGGLLSSRVLIAHRVKREGGGFVNTKPPDTTTEMRLPNMGVALNGRAKRGSPVCNIFQFNQWSLKPDTPLPLGMIS
ncbi:hypothetical protein LX36DRAFT_185971 [Colletotrichum falcatum]|nr:hypothetical protein LX36DRAFT_185971 [Colletotrichum falcatum]